MKLISFSRINLLILFLSCLTAFTNSQLPNHSVDYDKYLFFHWEGALTSHSLNIKIFPKLSELSNAKYNAFIALYTKSQAEDPEGTTIKPINFPDRNYSVAEVVFDTLSSNTQYFYSLVFIESQTLDPEVFASIYSNQKFKEFSFSTFGIALTRYNFTFGAASCAKSNSESPVFNSLRNEKLNFFIHMGDLHYMDILENKIEKFYEAYYSVFNSSTQKPFFQNTPVFYVWDDHDFGYGPEPNCRPAVTQAFRDFVPYGPLKNFLPSDDELVFPDIAPISNKDASEYERTSGEFGIFRSFLVGRCLFIIMDLRSFMEAQENDVLGNEQMNWLENQIRFAGKNEEVRQIFIVSSFPWITEAKFAEWAPYTSTQQKISDWVLQYIEGTNKHIMMLSGDAHMIAFDDGKNNRFGGFPIVQAASLDQRGSCKGGPYSHGLEQGPGHYASIEVNDYKNDTICVKVYLKNQTSSVISYDTCNPELYPENEMACPPPDDSASGAAFWVILVIVIGGTVATVYLIKRKAAKSSARDILTDSYVEMGHSGNRSRTPSRFAPH